MGLDCFWLKQCAPGKTAPEVKFDPELTLCGGMLSNHGDGSFRGKVYAEYIERVTGVSLFQECILNVGGWGTSGTVKEMALALEKYDGEKDEDHADLVRMFKAYADAGYDLHGWW